MAEQTQNIKEVSDTRSYKRKIVSSTQKLNDNLQKREEIGLFLLMCKLLMKQLQYKIIRKTIETWIYEAILLVIPESCIVKYESSFAMGMVIFDKMKLPVEQ